jgi:hypothetical protein
MEWPVTSNCGKSIAAQHLNINEDDTAVTLAERIFDQSIAVAFYELRLNDKIIRLHLEKT